MSGWADASHDDLVEQARRTRELVELIYAHPLFDKRQPERSPKMLWHTGDFLRRTFTDYIAPNLPPAMASLPGDIAFADPRCEDPRRGMPGGPPRSNKIARGDAVHIWPKTDKEKYTDALTRNMTTEMIILRPNDMMVQMMFPGAGGFDFGEDIKEKARALSKVDKGAGGKAAEGEGEGTGEGVTEASGRQARNKKKREKKKEKAKKSRGGVEGGDGMEEKEEAGTQKTVAGEEEKDDEDWETE